METTTPIRPLEEKSTEQIVEGDVVGDRPRKIGLKRKGVTLEGMYLFLEEIGFVEWRLPELWPSAWAQRRGDPQRESTLKLQHFSYLCEKDAYNGAMRERNTVVCKACKRDIAVGKRAYVITSGSGIPQRRDGFHETCIRLKEEHCKRCKYSASLGWRYVETYDRGVKLPWLQAPEPEIDEMGYEDNSPGLRNMTGYDLVAFVKEWLLREGLAHLSIAEVMSTESRFSHLRKHVRNATIFWSHSDLEPVIDHCEGTLVRIREAREKYGAQLPPVNDQFWWVDYFCLPQGVDHHFDTDEMIGLIQSIPYFVSSLRDKNKSVATYLSNSFCLLEIFSAMTREESWQYFGEDFTALAVTLGVGSMNLLPILASKKMAKMGGLSLPELRHIMTFLLSKNDGAERLICYGPDNDRNVIECQLAPHCPEPWRRRYVKYPGWAGPVKSEMSQTSNRHYKGTIDASIRNSVGFKELNERITTAILHSSPCGEHRRVCCQECPPRFFSHPCRHHQRAYCRNCFRKFCWNDEIKCKEHLRSCCSLCY
jgi:hypothetical protein